MTLQILVPQYHEGDATVRKLLDSIAMQRGVDFNEIGVVICSDGGDVRLSWQLLHSYPFAVDYVICKHAGVSQTRNAALTAAEAEYVMFCDADDAFYNACGLWMIFQDIRNGGFDFFVSDFLEECPYGPDGSMLYVSHKEDYVFVHGKAYRRAFLNDNGIQWDPELTVHEDSYFNLLCRELSQKTKICHVPFYMWCWRDDSVSRSSQFYILQTYPKLLQSNGALVTELERRGLHDAAQTAMASMMIDTYYTTQRDEWFDWENSQEIQDAFAALREYYADHKALWEETTETEIANLSAGCRTRHVREGMPMEKDTLAEWLHDRAAIL